GLRHRRGRRGGLGRLAVRGEHDRRSARDVAGDRRLAVGRRQGRRRRRVDRSRLRPSDRGAVADREERPDPRRRRAHAEGRRLRAPPPRPAPVGRRHRDQVALLADELGTRPAEGL
ncbi:MAG: Probable DNA-binding protein, partial [uncultured Nocardioidaceae bacterium]